MTTVCTPRTPRTLNNAQADAIIDQYDRVLRSGNDEKLVAFWETASDEMGEVLTELELQQLEQAANEARTRLAAIKAELTVYSGPPAEPATADKAEEQANRERREKIADLFGDGFPAARAAILLDIDGSMSRATLNRIYEVLTGAILKRGLYGWAKHWAFAHANLARDLSFAQGIVARFNRATGKVFDEVADTRRSPIRDQLRGLSRAEKALDQAQRQIPYGRPLEMARQFYPACEPNWMLGMARSAVAELRQKIAESRKKAAEKTTARRERQLSRAKKGKKK